MGSFGDVALTQPQQVLDVSLELLPEGALGGRVARLARQIFVPGVHRAWRVELFLAGQHKDDDQDEAEE